MLADLNAAWASPYSKRASRFVAGDARTGPGWPLGEPDGSEPVLTSPGEAERVPRWGRAVGLGPEASDPDDSLYVLLNAHHQPLRFTRPIWAWGQTFLLRGASRRRRANLRDRPTSCTLSTWWWTVPGSSWARRTGTSVQGAERGERAWHTGCPSVRAGRAVIFRRPRGPYPDATVRRHNHPPRPQRHV